MELENYRDLSSGGSDVSAGFQFEFYCTNCTRKWKSPFKPYRMGQITGLLTRFTFIFSDAKTAGRTTGNFADMGSRGARDKALADAMQHAQTLYTVCEQCNKAVCDDCWNTRERACEPCVSASHAQADDAQRHDREQTTAHSCPNCRASNSGGRFCAECGFDMASTHKSCPGCGVMLARQARFCTDCGHGF